MSKLLELNADNEEALLKVSKALSSPTRIAIVKLLYFNSYNIGEIAERLGIPASTAGVHVRALEEAGLINTEIQPGSHGSMKICSRKNDYISIRLVGLHQDIDQVFSISMPIGSFVDCNVSPTCGLCDENGIIGYEDRPHYFYDPKRLNAQLLWSSSGYVEYRFPFPLETDHEPKQLSLSFEACSEAPNFREDWPSDITIWINGFECATWCCPSDFGNRRGRLNPSWWYNGATQYGLLTTLEINADSTLLNGKIISNLAIDQLHLTNQPYISVRIGNKENADNIGGFNIFGRKFGDYEQDILLAVAYSQE